MRYSALMIAQVKAHYVRESGETIQVCSPEDAVAFWKSTIETASWFDEDKECVVVLCLDSQKKIKAYNLVSVGTLNECMAHPRDVWKPAILCSSGGIILMHNHPSGGTEPSNADRNLTTRTAQAGQLLSIDLVDHVIVGDGYYSFREAGLL